MSAREPRNIGYYARTFANAVRNLVETEARRTLRATHTFLSYDIKRTTPFFDPLTNTSIVTPDKDDDGYWAGAPSPFKDEETGEVYLYYRLRDADRRGKKGIIAKTEDGKNLEKIWEIDKSEIPAHSIEGAALEKEDGKYRLYLSYHDLYSNRWNIDILEADSIDELDYSESRPLEVSTGKFVNIKDPVIYGDDLIIHSASRFWFSQTNFFVKNPASDDPEAERIQFIKGHEGRISSILEKDGEELVFYDWQKSLVFTGEEITKIARKTSDLELEEITESNEAITAHKGTGSLRYVKSVEVDGERWFFYEKSMPNNGHKLCVNKVPDSKILEAEI